MMSTNKRRRVTQQDEDIAGAADAFNIVISQSVFVFDACAEAGPQLPGAVRLDAIPPKCRRREGRVRIQQNANFSLLLLG